MTPDAAFALANTLALVAWLALAASLFAPAMRDWTWRLTGRAIPALLAAAYLVILPIGLSHAASGGFNSISEVRTLFADDWALTAGWLHYLAFDLFVGTWIARSGLAGGAPWFVLLPCLAATFIFGPAGLLLALVLRVARGERGWAAYA